MCSQNHLPLCVYALIQPRRWIRVRGLDDLSASLERLRRSIPEVIGNDAPLAEQQRRLVDLVSFTFSPPCCLSELRDLCQALDVGRTLTRFNFQAEGFDPLEMEMLLAHHLTQLDQAQRDVAREAENYDGGDDQPRPEVADAILATSGAALTREQSVPESTDGSEQEDESDSSDDGVVVRNFRSTGPVLLPDDIPISSIRVDFTAGNMRVMTESTVDVTSLEGIGEGPSGTRGDRPSATNTLAEDRAEVGPSTPPDGSPEGTIITPMARSE